MVHTVLITAHPELFSVNRMALSYCESIVAQGESIKQIFFMHDANYIAIHPSAQQWSAFAAGHGIALQTCVSTAEQKSIHLRDYAAGFQQGGLSALADSLLSSEYFMQFNSDFDDADFASTDSENIESLSKVALQDKKKIMFMFDSAPEENSLAAEGIDLLLVLSAFEADISVVFKGEGVQNIIATNNQLPRYTKRFLAMEDFDVDQRYILGETNQTIQETKLPCELLSDAKFQQLAQQSHVLRF